MMMFRLLLILALAMALGTGTAAAKTRCLLVADAASGSVVHSEGTQCEETMGPASTFKLPLALIGFEAGILADPEHPAWPYKKSYEALRAVDRETTTPRRWLTESVIWFSRQLVAELGEERFAAAVRELRYGNGDVGGDAGANNGMTHSWLNSSLQITPLEHAGFIRRMLLGELAVSREAVEHTIASLPRFEGGAGWQIIGKTGTGYVREANGRLGKRQFGWFVGFGQREGRTLVFAYLSEDEKPGQSAAGPRTRDDLLKRWAGIAE
ncbi:MAG: class D beta-lactamase [Hyphomicrobiales bacterium]|nr:MAG: class D beta-lactamase [Hyphomicrobiales bacterium]